LAAGTRTRTRNVLVVLEVALAVILLIGSVLLVQTFIRLIHVNTGFRTDRILTMEIALPRTAPPARASDFFLSLIDRLAALPGVEAAGLTSGVPLSGSENLLPVTIEGQPRPQPGQEIISDYRVITAGYFEALAIPLLEGDPIQPPPESFAARLDQPDDGTVRLAGTVGGWTAIEADELRTRWPLHGGLHCRRYGIPGSIARSGRRYILHYRQDPRDQMAVVLRSFGDPVALRTPRAPPSRPLIRISPSPASGRWIR
jgi:hypothetical protein